MAVRALNEIEKTGVELARRELAQTRPGKFVSC